MREDPGWEGETRQALILDSLASDMTLSKALNCSGLICLCRMKSSLTIPSGSYLPIMHIGRRMRLAPATVAMPLRSGMV